MNVHDYVNDYEFRGEVDYTPTEGERAMIEDAIEGYLNDARAAPPAASADAVTTTDLIEMFMAAGYNDKKAGQRAFANFSPIKFFEAYRAALTAPVAVADASPSAMREAWQWYSGTWHTIDESEVADPEKCAKSFGRPYRKIYFNSVEAKAVS